MTNHVTILPAAVRFDRSLSPISVLLWGEISATCDQYSISNKPNGYFAQLLNVDTRTIIRAVSQLVDNGHLIKLEKEGSGRLLKPILKSIPYENITDIKQKDEQEALNVFIKKCLDLWDEKLQIKTEDRSVQYSTIRKFLKTFSQEEILTAIKNRLHYVTHNEWYSNPEFYAPKIDVLTIFETEKIFIKWLNYQEV